MGRLLTTISRKDTQFVPIRSIPIQHHKVSFDSSFLYCNSLLWQWKICFPLSLIYVFIYLNNSPVCNNQSPFANAAPFPTQMSFSSLLGFHILPRAAAGPFLPAPNLHGCPPHPPRLWHLRQTAPLHGPLPTFSSHPFEKCSCHLGPLYSI